MARTRRTLVGSHISKLRPPPSAAESKLPTRARLSIVLRNRLGCSHEVIAKLLGHPNQAASQSYHSRSLRTLRAPRSS